MAGRSAVAEKVGGKVLKPIEIQSKKSLTRRLTIRMLKMIAPICSECATEGFGWWLTCPHDPYHTMTAITREQKKYVKQEDGTYIEDGEEQIILRYKKIP